MSLQIGCLEPLIPQNGHAASSSTASLSGLTSAFSPSLWVSPLPTLSRIEEGRGWGGGGVASASRAAFHSHVGSVC